MDWWATGAVGAGDKWVEAEGESRWANLPSLSWAHVHHWRCIIIHPSPGAHGRRDISGICHRAIIASATNGHDLLESR